MTHPPQRADEPYPFTPVPLQRARHDGWTPERQRRLVTLLAATGVVTAAARGVGVSAQSAYRLRERPGAESFAAAWDAAQQEGHDRAFALALDRAINGYHEPRFYRGRQVGSVHRFDNRMALAAINAGARPTPPRPPRKAAR